MDDTVRSGYVGGPIYSDEAEMEVRKSGGPMALLNLETGEPYLIVREDKY
jgi:hypothetical protein